MEQVDIQNTFKYLLCIVRSLLRHIETIMFASYNNSLLKTKSGKSHTTGEQEMLSAMEEVSRTILKKYLHTIKNHINLQGHIDEIHYRQHHLKIYKLNEL